MEFENGVQFDPGFTAYISALVPNMEYVYGNIAKYKNFGQKKSFYKICFPKMEKLLDDYIAFYLGCMLWADSVKTLKDLPILNNFCCGSEYNEEESLSEVRTALNFTAQFIKDTKYYMGKDITFEEYKINILKTYEDFVKANEGFTKLEKTNDIKIPDTMKVLSENDAKIVIDKIEQVLQSGKLTELYEIRNLILQEK